MKNLKLIVILSSMIFTGLCYSQSGWFWQNPLPCGNSLGSVQFVNQQTGFIATDKGIILKSTNGGYNWNLEQTGTDAWIYSLHFINVNTGVAVGEKGTIIKTTNGGTNWNLINSSIYSSFFRVFFINNNTGWICGDSSKIFFTTNSGDNWVNRSPPYNYKYKSLHFIDENTGWVAADGFGILKTQNGGINWSYIDLGFSFTNGDKTDIQFINSTTGWLIASYSSGLSTYYRVLKSTNGGLNWNIHSSPTIWYLNDLHFVDSLYGWAVGNSENLRTTDGGITWNSQIAYSPASIYFINRNTGWTAGNYGHILSTTNGGINWLSRDTALTYNAFNNIYFINVSTGIITTVSREIFTTTNGGTNWSLKNQPPLTLISCMDFLNGNTGWVAGGGIICYTIDGGDNWVNLNSVSTNIRCIDFIDNQLAFIGGFREPCANCSDVGEIYKTTNNGLNWNIVYSINNNNFNTDIRAIYFINQNTGWLAGGGGLTTDGYGIITKTTNQGITWTEYFTTTSQPYEFRSIFFVNDLTGWICGRKGIMKTSNAGINWNTQFFDEYTHIFQSIFFVDANTGWSIDNRSNTYKTTNGGVNWLVIYNPARRTLLKTYFIDQNTGFLIGDYGTILKTTNGGGNFVIGLNNSNENNPIMHSLSQNYPNPFNPQTKIKFAVSSNVKGQTSNVKLIIYDLLGREVATLVNEDLKPGTYEADWDGSNYSSGVYFYKIISDGYTETKKMVLMK